MVLQKGEEIMTCELAEAFELWKRNSCIEFKMCPPKPDIEVIINTDPLVFAILKFEEEVNQYYWARIRIGF